MWPGVLGRVQLFVTPWTVARLAPLSVGFSMQEYWSGLRCPPPGDLPNPGIEPTSLTSSALAGRFFTSSTTWEAPYVCCFGIMINGVLFHDVKINYMVTLFQISVSGYIFILVAQLLYIEAGTWNWMLT